MCQRTTPQANPVRHPASQPGLSASPRIGSAVVTPTISDAAKPDWLLAGVAFALALIATVAVSL